MPPKPGFLWAGSLHQGKSGFQDGRGKGQSSRRTIAGRKARLGSPLGKDTCKLLGSTQGNQSAEIGKGTDAAKIVIASEGSVPGRMNEAAQEAQLGTIGLEAIQASQMSATACCEEGVEHPPREGEVGQTREQLCLECAQERRVLGSGEGASENHQGRM